MPKRKLKTKARANGEGSVYKREVTRKDGSTFERWEGKVTIGYDENGKRRRRVFYGKTEAEVIQKVLEVRQQIATGTLTDTALTVKDYLARWLQERQKQVKRSTFDEYKRCVEKRINPRIGSMKLAKVKPMHIQNLVSDIAAASGAPTANKCRVVLFSAFKQAIRWEVVIRNPVEAVDPLPVKKRKMKLWSPVEAARFLDTARAHRLYALFYLDMATGLRRGELLGLQWQDLKGTMLHVQRSLLMIDGQMALSSPKSAKGTRRVALTADVLEVLELHRAGQQSERVEARGWPESGYVFLSTTGTPLRPDNLRRLRLELIAKARKAWRESAESLGDGETVKRLDSGDLLPDIRLHDLRHLHASILIREGKDPKTVADRLGHARASFTLDTYTHLFDDQRLDAAVSLTKFLNRAEPETLN